MKYDKIVAINKEKSREKAEIAINEIEKMFQRKERISVTVLSKNTGFAKSFFYRNPEVRKALDEALLQQGALEETNNNLKSAVMRLKKQIVELERDKSRLEKKVEELTRELEKQKK